MAITLAEFAHVSLKFRGKVAQDMLSHLTADKQWDYAMFNGHNDYQRHLHALFLRLAGVPEAQVWARVFALSDDVAINQRQQYVDDVLHSEIVGFTWPDGSVLAIPDQDIESDQEVAEE